MILSGPKIASSKIQKHFRSLDSRRAVASSISSQSLENKISTLGLKAPRPARRKQRRRPKRRSLRKQSTRRALASMRTSTRTSQPRMELVQIQRARLARQRQVKPKERQRLQTRRALAWRNLRPLPQKRRVKVAHQPLQTSPRPHRQLRKVCLQLRGTPFQVPRRLKRTQRNKLRLLPASQSAPQAHRSRKQIRKGGMKKKQRKQA
mmetsp:Transcript_3099/g.7525  ORF Transcript_3099/g.7525 Transcript_3099/m.7525 type:complete len:206 (+) Transcript_3099:636-1253(+)